MKTLGISIEGHDSGITFLEKETIEHFELERFTKIKHDSFEFNKKNKKNKETYNFFNKLKIFSEKIKKYKEISNTYVSNYGHSCLFPKNIINSLPLEHIDHKMAHASSVYNINNCLESLIVVIDYQGSGKVAIFKGVKNNIQKIETYYNLAFGIFYSSFSCYIINSDSALDDSGKFMGFSAYGKLIPEIYKDFYDMSYETSFLKDSLDTKAEKEAKKRFEKIVLKYKDYDKKDISYCFQKAWVKKILDFISQYKDISKNICVAGGCFLNCELNRELINSGWFEKVYFTPVPNDSGQSFGAAILNTKITNFTPFCGDTSYDSEKLPELIKNYKTEEVDLKKVAKLIYGNKIIGVFRGSMEIGPRALGNRSILANPLNPDMKDILNQRVKHREWYRPYGAVIQREYLKEFFDMDIDAPYMNILMYNKTSLFPAVTHVDNSTRVQTLKKQENEFLYDLLKEFKNVSGYPILLNTSFNVRGYPIINYYEDAIKMLEKNELDYIILENNLVYKA